MKFHSDCQIGGFYVEKEMKLKQFPR